ncbi:MAG: tyrosine-type recombinase/integrase [Gemmatimonadota bacterium]|nr:tyrosine-type recombinase/integrase [Gemmatimonadota bacterium]
MPEPTEPPHRPRTVEIRRTTGGELAVRFEYAADLIAEIKRIPGRRWVEGERHWTIPARTAALALLLSRFRSEDLVLERGVEGLLPKTGLEAVAWRPQGGPQPRQPQEALDQACRAALTRMHEELILRGYSPRTRRLYLDHARRFLVCADCRPEEVDAAVVRSYVRSALEDRRVSHSYADQAVSAIKFLFARVLSRPIDPVELPRPKRQRKLPVVLSRQEVLAIFEVIENAKHRAILMLVYAAGLRVGEVVRLRIEDIDRDRGLIHVRQAKGRKDRYVPLSSVALTALERYARQRRIRGPWVFPGQRPGRHLTTRSVQQVFARARQRARIRKPVTVHTLRHSFATHLHESGIGLRYIQSLLGHKSPRTTEIYTHVSRADLAKIRSPLDQLMDPGGDER